MTSAPALSVVMPARNVAPYVDAAIRSILSQSFTDFELVIRDDGSTDGTSALLREWAQRDRRIRLFEGEQLGLAGSSNWVVRQARAPIVARMDADDIARPDRLACQLQVLRDDPTILLVGSLADSIDCEGRRIRGMDLWRVTRRSWFPPFPHTSIMFRRDAFEDVGGYRSMAYCEDWDLYLRVSNQGRVAVIADALVSHRLLASSSSGSAEYHEKVVTALDAMMMALPPAGSDHPYRPAVSASEAEKSLAARVDPMAIISSRSTLLWSGGSPRAFGELLRRGKLRLSAASLLAVGWAGLAHIWPAALRTLLRGLSLGRNLAAGRRVKLGQVYEWQPGGGQRRGAARESGASPQSVVHALRVGDWWDFKLTPPAAVFCGTILIAGEPIAPHWPSLALLLAAVAVCAAYVGLINELFDREEDARSNKPNRLAGVPATISRLTLVALATIAVAIAIAIGSRAAPMAILAYAGSWIAFTAYSAPPFRLKTKGLPGVLADAAGSTFFPVMLAIMLAAAVLPAGVDPLWIGAAAAWASGWGLRCILWHQIIDSDRDRAGAVRTFVQRHGQARAITIIRNLAIPLELVGILVLLALTQSLVPLFFLATYAAVVAGRTFIWRVRNPGLFPGEFYDALLPVAIVVASALRHPQDWLLLVPYFILFWRRPSQVLHHAVRLSWYLARRSSAHAFSAASSLVRGRLRFD